MLCTGVAMSGDAVATAEAVLNLMRSGRFADIDELIPPALRGLGSAEELRDPWQELITKHGPITAVSTTSREPAGPDATAVRILVTCERGAFAVLMVFDRAAGLQSLQFAPPEAAEPLTAWQPPTYVDPACFTEHEVTVDCAPLATPGTLSLPDSPQPAPAVVLLAGSGPLDRDVTMGRNKVFRDLAWGLASRGVVVLRFDKVTYTHRDTLADISDFTVVDEYVRPAVAAIRLLREHPSVDGTRIFVLGHSQGGTLAPRVADAEPAVAGLVVLAGATQPMHHTAMRQLRYLAALRDPGADPDADPTLQAAIRQWALIDSPDLSPTTPAHLLPPGAHAAYWLDLRDYDPVAVAAQLDIPMLIVQGGRDYQVTVADDLNGWRAGLADRSNVTISVYPADNHQFFAGSGPSTPAEYEPAQHVDEAVVTEVGQWIAGAHT